MFARIVALTAAALSLFVGVALADAPNPIPGTTTLVSSSGTLATGLTITIEGQWNWTTHNDCPANRDGVGYQVDWNDGNTANPIGDAKNSPNGIIYVGSATNNMVFSLNNLNPSNTDLNFGGLPGAPFGAVPASYQAHNTTSSTPTMTDANNWNSNCGTTNPTTELSTGTWGPISHTYPAGFAGPIEVCPIMYDPHGKSENAGGSGVGDLTAGGMGHNNDNSYEGNGTADACDLTAFPTMTTTATAAAHETQQISDAATLAGSMSAAGSISWTLLKYPAGTTSSAIAADQCKSGTPITGSFTTNVNGNGTYTSPPYTVPTGGAGVYQWLATYTSSNGNNANFGPVGCGVAGEESVVTPLPAPSLTLTKQQAWDTGGSVPGTAIPSPGTFTSSAISGAPGWIIDYKMTVTNTGNETVGINFADPAAGAPDAGCDAGTLSSTPTVISGTYTPGAAGNGYGGLPTLTAGGQVVYTCRHTVLASDNPWVNTASLSGIDINGTAVTAPNASVQNSAINPKVGFQKLQQISGSGGGFTHSDLNGMKGQVVNYQMTVTNPSATDSLALVLNDPGCASNSLTAPTGTGVSGTTVFSGSGNTIASGNTLAPGGTAVYTCTHTITTSDTPFVNTANLTATDTTTQQQLTATDSVRVFVQLPTITLTKAQQVNTTNAGGYVSTPVNAYVGNTLHYLLTITNTGANEVTPTLTDSAASGGICDAGTLTPVSGLVGGKLAAGASATWTCSHLVTAGDPTTLTNTASATAVDDSGNSVGPVTSSVTANVLTLTLTLVKQQRIGGNAFSSAAITVQPDNIIDYQMTVTNASNQALTPTFTDPNFPSGSSAGGCDAGTLVPPNNLINGMIPAGGTAIWTCQHTVSETDPSPFVNTATVFGTDSNGHITPTQTSSVSATLFLNPAMTTQKLQLDATTNPGGSYTSATITANVGDTIDYKVIVNNTGNEDLTLAATDPGCGTTLVGPTITPGEDSDDLVGNVLEQGASAMYTCSRTLSASDAPSFTNVATITGTPPVGPALPPQMPQVTVNVLTNPQFTIAKTQSVNGSAFTNSTLTGQVGQVVAYHITVTNTGNTTLTFSNFSDPNCDAGTISGGPTGPLAVNGSAVYSCSHTLTFTDQGHGSYNNQATVTGTPPTNQGSAVTNMSNVVTVTLAAPNPAFTLVKSQSINGSAFTQNTLVGQVGQTINYQIVATNTGNVPLTFSGFSDPNCTNIQGGPGGSSVAVGGTTTWTCSHLITAADQAAGSYSNSAMVTGNPPANDGTPVTNPSNTVVTTVPTNSFTIVKTQALGSNPTFVTAPITGASPGQVVNYQITVTNTGNTALTLSNFTDPNCDTVPQGGPGGNPLQPNSSTTYTCLHTLTFADQAAGMYTNQATVVGNPPAGFGPSIPETSNQVVVTLVPANPQFSLVKTQSINGSSPVTTPITGLVGQTVNYTITATNTGNVPLTFTNFTDSQCDSGTIGGGPGVTQIPVNGTTSWTCSHTLTAADQTNGTFSNSARVTGNPPANDGTPVTNPSNTVVTNVPNNAFTIAKLQSIGASGFTNSTLSGTPGQTVNYQITVTNTGNTSLTFSNFSDPNCDAGTIAGGSGNTPVATGGTAVWTCSHVLTFADQAAGSYTNQANVTATPPANSGSPFAHSSNQVVVTLPPANPGYTIVKSQSIGGASFTTSSLTGLVGQTVNYQILVTNTGTVPLTFSNFTDANCTGIAGGPGNTAVAANGGTTTWTCSHVLTAADQAATSYTNTATVTGAPPIGSAVTQSSNPVVVNLPTNAFTIVKTESIGGAAFTQGPITGNPGQTVNYQITVDNTGTTPLTFSAFTDANCDPGTIAGGPGGSSVAPGASSTYTCSHLLTFADQSAGTYTNQASVTGTPPAADGSPISHTSNQVVVNLPPAGPSYTLVKTQSIGGAPFVTTAISGAVGQTINYQIVATNTGNVPLTFSNFTDANCTGISGGPGNTAVAANGGTTTWTCSHVITAADQTVGTYTNQASVTGTPPVGNPINNPSNPVVANVPNNTFTIVKTQAIGAGTQVQTPITGSPGQTVNYQITVTNSGNTSLTFSNFIDANCDAGTIAGGPGGAIAPGGSATYTCSHVLTFTDQGAGTYTNQATVTATPPANLGSSFSKNSNQVVVNLTPASPSFTIVKTQGVNAPPSTTGPVTALVGQTVNYQILVTNTGNVPLTFTNFSDPNCDAGTLTGGPGNSAVAANGGTTLWSCSHIISAADLATGTYTNIATVTGNPPTNDGTPIPNVPSNKVIANVPNPAFTLVKTQAIGGGSFTQSPLSGSAGQTVNYEVTATNTGNVALTFTAFTDGNCDAGTISGGPGAGSVAVGSTTTWTCSHTLTAADQGVGSYTNSAKVTGDPPANMGSPVTNTSNTVIVNLAAPNTTFTLVKTQAIGANTPTAAPIVGAVGQVVNYTITATNTGNVPETFTNFSDPHCDPGTLSGGPGNSAVAVGASTSWTCTHVLTAADQTIGSYSNQATVTSNPPPNDGTPTTVPSNTVVTTVPPNTPNVVQPTLTIVKSQRDLTTNPNGAFTTATINANVGDTIQYQIVVSNPSTTAATLTFSDPICDANTLSGPANGTSLAGGASATYTCTHVITAAGIPAVTNTATVTGTPPGGGTPVGPFSSTVVTNVAPASNPSLKVVKTQKVSGSSAGYTTSTVTAATGDTILYHLTVTNTGNVALKLSLSDTVCDSGTLTPPTSGLDSSGDLPVGGTVVYSCSHKIKAGEAGTTLTNTVSVTGTPPGGTPTQPVTSSVATQIPHPVVPKACDPTETKSSLTRTTAGKLVYATVTGKNIKFVTFLLDGRGYKTLTKPNHNGGYRISLVSTDYAFGTHTITAKVSVKCGNARQAKIAFTHSPPSHPVTPKFTG